MVRITDVPGRERHDRIADFGQVHGLAPAFHGAAEPDPQGSGEGRLRDSGVGAHVFPAVPPGTPLRQRNLAEQFYVSNTPVREALRRLESEGLVVTDVHRGATVARTESEELEENYRILAALEALAGSLAVAKITDDDIADIEVLYREVAACLPDDGRLAELNRQFHFRVYECARSPMLLLLMRLLWRSFPHGPQAGRPHQESVRQHDALVRALKHRNEEQVAAIIRDHVLGSIKYLPQR
jgi:DNA-binding GntR family transcriptional regulator